ncbi:MAG: nodulation protein NfeD [Candidatus Aminicenantes bacterium]|nr:nodulation protein NfeD [Candidatus Aminicenantes bacterium]
MRKNIFLIAILGACLPVLCRASIFQITIDAPINAVTAEYVVQAVDRADAEKAELLIIALNTPGGLDTSMRQIIEKILGARTPSVAWVSPSGARSASAGLFIALACDLFIMAPGTNTGAAHPVGVAVPGQSMDQTMADKITEDAAAYIKSLAERRGRNVAMAENAVRKSLSYTAGEALEGGLIDGLAGTTGDLIGLINGKTITRFSGQKVTLALEGQPLTAIPLSSRQKFLLTIANPNLAYLLLMLGLLGLYFELAHPGVILPGVLGSISLILAFFAFQILPINYAGLALILLAVLLFILEIKVVSHGLLAIGGVVAMLIGSIMLIRSNIPELKPSLNIIIPVVLGFSLILILLVTVAARALRRKVLTGVEGLAGEIGTARTDLDPEGQVFVHGEGWRAAAESVVPKGSKVRVISVEQNLTLKVAKL